MVELLVVVQAVAGSNPVIHPNRVRRELATEPTLLMPTSHRAHILRFGSLAQGLNKEIDKTHRLTQLFRTSERIL